MSYKTPSNYWLCCSCLEFEHEIEGSRKGTTYTVRHGFIHHYRDRLLDFSCTCPSYEYNRHKGHRYCKHIEKVIDDKLYCGWDQMQDGLEPINEKCPKCGGNIVTINTVVDDA